jgi:hypothetical protein
MHFLVNHWDFRQERGVEQLMNQAVLPFISSITQSQQGKTTQVLIWNQLREKSNHTA